MKRLLVLLVAGMALQSCGSEETAKEEEKTADTATTAPGGTAGIPNERGLELIGGSDCTTCHAIDRKIIGPAYIDVANKYEISDAVVDTLVSKIKNGGMGVWGNIPMTPHPDLPEADAKEMVKYILSLKNQ